MSLWGPGYFSNRLAGGYGPSPPWNASGLRIENVGEPEDGSDAATLDTVTTAGGASTTYVDGQDALRVLKAGDTMTGDLLFTTAISETDRRLGCTTNSTTQKFTLFLGDNLNRIEHTDDTSQTQGVVLYSAGSSFRVKVDDVLICQLGIANFGYISEFQKPISMANNAITDVADPTDAQDVATKNYVDSIPILSYDGHIPPMSANTSQTGFIASASSFFSANYQPFMAFSPQLVPALSVNEWAANNEGAGAWIQIQCPASVRIWKIRLRGRTSNTERITSWNLAGSTGGAFTTLLTSTTTLGAAVQEFLVTTIAAFSIYRLNVVAAEPLNPGLSHFQVFSRSI